ncbi:MAG: META domain-containing protein [Pseudomonas sp.]
MYLIRTLAPPAILTALVGCNAGVVEQADIQPAFNAELHCGLLPISVIGQGEQMQLQVKGEQIELRQVISASGAHYVAPGEEETSLWFKGEQAALVLQGIEYPQCAPVGAIIEPFRAAGNEPFWVLTLEAGSMVLNRLHEGELPAQPYTAGEQAGQVVSQSEPQIHLQVTDQLCRDDMSGMPFPKQVTVQVGDAELQGCGGDSARLLQGAEWVVEDINAGGIIDRSWVTLNFWQDGRITGSASCNNLMGQYQLTGEGLGISQVVTTRMVCPPSLMEQEQRVLKNLQTLQSFDFDSTGALLLRATEGTLKARLEN